MNFNKLKFIFIFILFQIIGMSSAVAYHLKCQFVFNSKIAKLVTPDSKFQLENAIVHFKEIFMLKDIKHNKSHLDDIRAKFSRLSERDKNSLKLLIQKNYNLASAFKYQNIKYKSFKRNLDLILTEFLETADFFSKRKNWPIEKTLDEYFQLVSELTNLPIVTQGKDLLKTALQIQQKISNKDKRSFIVLYGSFVNGRAYAEKSDLDFAVSTKEMEDKFNAINLAGYLSEFPFSEAQAHLFQNLTVKELGYLNPIVLVIRKDKILIHVSDSFLYRDNSTEEVEY